MRDTTADLERFYSLLSRLETFACQGLQLATYSGKTAFPVRGVYFFRESGEYRSSNPSIARVVRVGTHAVSAASKSTLWGRLKTHLGTRAGGGNHRGSIFRLHVGAAMLARDCVSLPTWGIGSSAPSVVRESPTARAAEATWERKVSEYIGAMTVLWVVVPDELGRNSKRVLIERNAISLLSNHLAPIDSASMEWLGRHSPRHDIQRSSLWNLNHVDETYDPQFLDVLETAVEQMGEQG
jgi:hypothetical protein